MSRKSLKPLKTLKNNKKTMKRTSNSPWTWIPSLYFAEGLPYVVVMTVSLILYKQLGLSNKEITFYTSWLYLPWVIKPLWSPLVDVVKTKRWWIVTMQLLIGAAHRTMAAGHAVLLLGDGIQQRHARHRGGRLLHARS